MNTKVETAVGNVGKMMTNIAAAMPNSSVKQVEYDKDDIPTGTDAQKVEDSIGSTSATDQFTASTQAEQAAPEVQKQTQAQAASDERMKDIAGRLNLTDTFANINSYLYKYKPEIQKEYNGEKHVDGEPHVGVLAQELEANPVTQSTVKTDENGFKNVDTAQLALTLAAVVSDMAKEIKDLKNKIGV